MYVPTVLSQAGLKEPEINLYFRRRLSYRRSSFFCKILSLSKRHGLHYIMKTMSFNNISNLSATSELFLQHRVVHLSDSGIAGQETVAVRVDERVDGSDTHRSEHRLHIVG